MAFLKYLIGLVLGIGLLGGGLYAMANYDLGEIIQEREAYEELMGEVQIYWMQEAAFLMTANEGLLALEGDKTLLESYEDSDDWKTARAFFTNAMRQSVSTRSRALLELGEPPNAKSSREVKKAVRTLKLELDKLQDFYAAEMLELANEIDAVSSETEAAAALEKAKAFRTDFLDIQQGLATDMASAMDPSDLMSSQFNASAKFIELRQAQDKLNALMAQNAPDQEIEAALADVDKIINSAEFYVKSGNTIMDRSFSELMNTAFPSSQRDYYYFLLDYYRSVFQAFRTDLRLLEELDLYNKARRGEAGLPDGQRLADQKALVEQLFQQRAIEANDNRVMSQLFQYKR